MATHNLINLVVQMQAEIENLAVRGIRSIDHEQQTWLKNTRDSLREMGAEFLATRVGRLLDAVATSSPSGEAPGYLLDLLTTIRIFNRVLTLDQVKYQVAQLVPDSEGDEP